jgi:hypothetical protein
MEKVTVEKAKNEIMDFLIAAFGTSLGIVLMKMATRYGVNQWLVPGVGLIGGVGLRVYGNSPFMKSIGTGIGIAGAADLTKKGIDYAGTKIPALANFTKDLPNFSGFPSDPMNFSKSTPSMLRGGMGDFTPAEVVSSRLLRN